MAAAIEYAIVVRHAYQILQLPVLDCDMRRDRATALIRKTCVRTANRQRLCQKPTYSDSLRLDDSHAQQSANDLFVSESCQKGPVRYPFYKCAYIVDTI